MNHYDPEWTLDILARIRVYHGAQDTGRAAEVAWTEALDAGGVRSGTDAVTAVVRHYSQPGCNPWITPGDVIAGVRTIRAERLQRSDHVLPDVDPDDVQAWLTARRVALTAVADGRVDVPRETDGAQDPRVQAALPHVFRRPPRGLPGSGGDRPRPIEPRRDVDPATAAAHEAERERQLAALEALRQEPAAEAS